MADNSEIRSGQDVTLIRFDEILSEARELFAAKTDDYGPTWTAFRWVSLVDQMWIKARRIRTLEETEDQALVPEGREPEYVGLINYAVVGLLRWWHAEELPSPATVVEGGSLPGLSRRELLPLYGGVVERVRELLSRKNHDYGQAWQHMDLKSITDQIIVKILRMKTILTTGGTLQVSENLDGHFCDILNYSVLALVQLRKYRAKLTENDLAGFCRFCCPPDDERVLLRDMPFYVMLSLGPLVSGHLLVIPNRHVPAFGALAFKDAQRFRSLIRQVSDVFKVAYPSRRVVQMEYGDYSTGRNRDQYVGHARMHFLHVDPESGSLTESASDTLGVEPVRYRSLHEFVREHKAMAKPESYVLIHDGRDYFVYYVGGMRLGRHFLRRLFIETAEHVAAHEDWLAQPDWPRVLESRGLLLRHFAKLHRTGRLLFGG